MVTGRCCSSGRQPVNEQIAREAARARENYLKAAERADMAAVEAAKAKALALSLLDIHLAWEKTRLTAEAA